MTPLARPEDMNNREHPAYWAYRGWCAARDIHYTEVWYETNVRDFLDKWNAQEWQKSLVNGS